MTDHSVRSPSTDGESMREALESARLDFHSGLDKLDRAIDKIQSSDGSTDGRAKACPLPGGPTSAAASAESSTARVGIKPGPSEANSPAAPVEWSDERLAELVQLIDWDTGLTIADEVRQLREVFKLAVLPAPVDAGVREAFIAGATAVHEEWVAAHERGEGPPRGDPEFGEAAGDYALSSQPVVGVDQGSIATKPTSSRTFSSRTSTTTEI
jgi:hypothetical protein